MVEDDLSLEARARTWIDMAQTKWRLQTMQHRSVYNAKTGEYRQLPTRVRRFLNGTPVGLKTRVLELLKESAPYSCPVFDLETGDMKYVPTSTFIRKDGPELTSGGADATYTIVQDLRLLDEAGDTFGLRDESSCAQVGESEWHWDEPSVADCPDSSQGVSYQVANVSRDRDTDLFSYVIRKVQSLTVHTPPVVTACGERTRVTVETWDNVYGEVGSFRFDPVRGASAPLDVPEACDRSDGTLVKVTVNRNADCTYRVEVERTEAVTGVGMYYSQHDLYKSETGERTLNAFAPLPKNGVEYASGVITRYQSEHNEDGTWTNEINRTRERPVTSSTVEERVTPRGTTRTRVDTNVLTPATGISSDYGSWKATKTPGGLFTNEYREIVRRFVDNLGLMCTDTAFAKTHETQGSAEAVPISGHVPVASNGRVTTWVYDTDADGLVTSRVRTVDEHTVLEAVRRRVWGWLGTTSSYTHRSVSASVAESMLASGSAGTSVEARLTEGGLFDVEVQAFTKIAGVQLGYDCQKTVYQHLHEIAESASSFGTEVQAAGGGKTYKRSYTLDTSSGAITKRETVAEELTVDESRRVVRVSPRGTTVRTVSANAASKPADPNKVGETMEFEVTPGGRYNVTKESVTPSPGNTAVDCSKDIYEHVHGTSQTARTAPNPSDVDPAGGGEYREMSSRQGDDGLWETRTVSHKEETNVDEGFDVTVTARGKRTTTRTRGVEEKPEEPEKTEIGRSLRVTRTRGGLYTKEDTTTTPNPQELRTDESKDEFDAVTVTGKTSDTKEEEALEEPGNGKYHQRRQSLGDDGLWDIEHTEHEELEADGQRVETRVTRFGKVTRTTDLHKKEAHKDIKEREVEADAGNIGNTLISEKTRGGLFNVTLETLDRFGADVLFQKTCSKDVFLHTDTVVKSKGSLKPDNPPMGEEEDIEDPAPGTYTEKVVTLNDQGVWEERETKVTEIESEDILTSRSVDAFSKRMVEVKFHTAAKRKEDATFDKPGKKIVSIEQERTKGDKFNTKTTEEEAISVDSRWLKFKNTTSEGLSIYYDFIVFRNKTKEEVKDYITQAEDIEYSGGIGSYAVRPSINISPNRFGLWDGSIALTTTFTPAKWASGGNSPSQNLEEREYTVKDVSVSPLNSDTDTDAIYLLEAITTETHKRGAGVGKDKLESKLSGTLVRGSTFSYHPSGQAFQYDIITKRTVKYKVVKASGTVSTDDSV